ncbi:MAG: response regulator [Desulfovibrionaceae bacterium]
MMRVLVVEDNPLNQEFLKAIMASHGAVCEAVGSAEEALEAFERAHIVNEPFDLIFMDIILPNMDGQQALENIRAMEKARPAAPVKVIMTTSLDDNKNMTRAFFQGQAISYLTKPFTVDKISMELQRFGLIG